MFEQDTEFNLDNIPTIMMHNNFYNITHYEVIDGYIVLFCNNDEIFKMQYDRDIEKAILMDMKNNFLYRESMNASKPRKIGNNIFGITWCTLFAGHDIGCMINSDTEGMKSLFATFAITMAVLDGLYIKRLIKNIKDKKDIEKIRYFLDNEQIINKEIIERYRKEHADQTQEIDLSQINLITINTVQNMTIQELREIVENIKNNEAQAELKLTM